MSKQKKKNRRAYLNDFRLGENGEYSYAGAEYTPIPKNGKSVKRAFLEITSISAICTFLSVLGGCIPSAGMLNCFYVIIPFICEIASVVSVLWIVCRMMYHGFPLREYIYTATAEKLTDRCRFPMIFSVLGLVCTVIYVFLNGFDNQTYVTLIYLLLKISIFLLFFILKRLSNEITWKKTTVSLMNE